LLAIAYLGGFLSSQTSARIENFRSRGQLVILNGSFCVKLLAEYFTKQYCAYRLNLNTAHRNQ